MFNETVLALSLDAKHEGDLEGATHTGLRGLPGEGEYVLIELRLDNGIVQDARFKTYTCPVARASCELVCRVIERKSLKTVALLSGDDVIVLLRGLPEGKRHLPFLACDALRDALSREQTQ